MLAVVATFVAALGHRAHRAPPRGARRRDRPERRAVRRDLGARLRPLGADDRGLRARRHRSTSSRCSTPRWRRGARGSRAPQPRVRNSSAAARSWACSSSRSRSRSDRAFPARAVRAWIQYRSLGTGSGSNVLNVTSPLVSVRAKLNGKESTHEVFTVRTTEPKGDYWRVIALDQFQDDGWGLNSDQRSATELPGATHARGYDARHPDVPPRRHRRPLAAGRVPPDPHRRAGFAGAPRLDLAVPRQPARRAQLHGAVRGREPRPVGARSGHVRRPRTDVGRPRAPRATSRAGPAASPRSSPPTATTPYDKALALMKSFQSAPFTYDTTVDLGTTANALDKFLFETHRGFCEQYRGRVRRARAVDRAPDARRGRLPAGHARPGRALARRRRRTRTPGPRCGSATRWAGTGSSRRRGAPTRSTGLGTKSPGGRGATTTTTTTRADERARRPRRRRSPRRRSDSQIHVQPPPTTVDVVAHRRARRHRRPRGARDRRPARSSCSSRCSAFGAWRRTRRRRHDPDDRRRVLGAWTEALERLDGGRASIAGRRRRRSSSRCVRRPRSARAPPVRRSWTWRACTPPRCTRPTRRRRPRPTRPGRRSTRSSAALRATRAADPPLAGPLRSGLGAGARRAATRRRSGRADGAGRPTSLRAD